MQIKLPGITITVHDIPNHLSYARILKAVVVMITAYWMEICQQATSFIPSPTITLQTKKEMKRNLKLFGNPRLINRFLRGDISKRRLSETNDNLVALFGQAFDYENVNPNCTPRVMSIAHAISHTDTKTSLVRGVNFTSKAHCLTDMLSLYAKKPFDDFEQQVVYKLVQSRLLLMTTLDFSNQSLIEVTDPQQAHNLVREMFLLFAVYTLIGEILQSSKIASLLLTYKTEVKRVKLQFEQTHGKINTDMINFIDFISSFVHGLYLENGYSDECVHGIKTSIKLIANRSDLFAKLQTAIVSFPQKISDTDILESTSLPLLDTFLINWFVEWQN